MQGTDLQTGKVKISTCTYIADSGLKNFDLESIYEFIELDDELLGLKYNNTSRGDIKGTKTFYNQISARIKLKNLENKETNLKIFSNGKFQITGVKTEEHVIETIKVFMKKAVIIYGKRKLNLKKHLGSGIIVKSEDFDESIFSKKINISSLSKSFKFYKKIKSYENPGAGGNFFVSIGEIKGSKFSINGEFVVYDDFVNGYISEKHTNRLRRIYDTDGVEIGHYRYEMLYNRKHLVLHGVNYKETENEENVWDIFNSFGNLTGKRYLVINESFRENIFPLQNGYNPKIETPSSDYEEICGVESYSYTSDSAKIYDIDPQKLQVSIESLKIKISNLNCSFQVYLKDQDVIDKIKLHNLINTNNTVYKGVSCHYKADSRYQAVCFRIYVDEKYEFVDINHPGAHRITATIFKSGKTMLSGCLNKKHILAGRKKILQIIGENYDKVIVLKPVIDKSEVIVNHDISIWDL